MKRDYIAVWSILACAFILFFVFSIFDSPVIAGIRIKTSKMAESVCGKADDNSPAAVPIAAAAIRDTATVAIQDTTAAAESLQPRQDTLPLSGRKHKVLLMIGDSMLEGLLMRLGAYCQASGDTLYSAIWYSSTSELYAETRLISDYIAKYHPDFIFLSLGGNELFVRDVVEKREKHVKSILDEIGDIPYLWIGPPNWKEDTGINDLIDKDTPEGCFFRSDGMQMERKRDGAHPTSESAYAWMDSILSWMPAHSRYFLQLQPPAEEAVRPYRLFIHQPGPLTDRPR